jgi:hypothetical protein
MHEGFAHDEIPIFGGRWQPLHVGHEYVAVEALKGHAEGCIAVVNPDPATPPVSPSEFERFERSINPLTYFERLSLWREVLRYNGLERKAAVVPSWHPRKFLELDNAILPPRSRRFWIVPDESEEEAFKARDKAALGERVRTDIAVPRRLLGVRGTEIRKRVQAHTPFRTLLPLALQAHGEAVVLGGVCRERKYSILPMIAEVPDIGQLAEFFRQAEGTEPVVCLPVNIQDADNWWRLPEKPPHCLTFYERYRLIAAACRPLTADLPTITPIFAMQGGVCVIEAFLPPRRSRRWIVSREDRSMAGCGSTLHQEGESVLESLGAPGTNPSAGREALEDVQALLTAYHYKQRNASSARQ